MTRRERFALRSPAWCDRIPLGAIRHVEADVPPVEREAAPVAIASTHFLGQTPLDGVRTERYIGKSAQVVPPLE